MLAVAQRVEDQCVHAGDLRAHGVGHGFAVAQVGDERASAADEKIPVRRHAPVRYRQRDDLRVAQAEWAVHGMRLGMQVAGPAVLPVERKRKDLSQLLDRGLRAIDRQHFSTVAECPQIIEAHDVIRVRVRDHHGIEPPDVFTQRLRAEIRSRVHDPRTFRGLDVGCGARAFVARIGRAADRAVAREHRDAVRGAGAEEGEGEIAHEGRGASGAGRTGAIGNINRRWAALKFGVWSWAFDVWPAAGAVGILNGVQKSAAPLRGAQRPTSNAQRPTSRGTRPSHGGILCGMPVFCARVFLNSDG